MAPTVTLVWLRRLRQTTLSRHRPIRETTRRPIARGDRSDAMVWVSLLLRNLQRGSCLQSDTMLLRVSHPATCLSALSTGYTYACKSRRAQQSTRPPFQMDPPSRVLRGSRSLALPKLASQCAFNIETKHVGMFRTMLLRPICSRHAFLRACWQACGKFGAASGAPG